MPENIHCVVSKRGSMTTFLMKEWIQNCFIDLEDDFEIKILVMFEFSAHKEITVMQMLEENKIAPLLLPPKTTSYLQPLDVLINAIFKREMKNNWDEWMMNGTKEFTKKRYRKRPSWQNLVDWISQSVNSIQSEDIKKSFRLCGIESSTDLSSDMHLNSKLQSIISGVDYVGNESANFDSHDDLLTSDIIDN